MDVPSSADVVIVGGGIMGTSVAFHLAEAGVRVVLVERGELGSGSTCKAAGGVRAQFSDVLNIQLGARSLAAYRRFGRTPGQDVDLRTTGYLFLLSRPGDVASFEAGVALQNELGVPSRMVDVTEARRLSPLIATDGLLAAAWAGAIVQMLAGFGPLQPFLDDHLARYKHPKEVVIVEALPRNASGKVVKNELRGGLSAVVQG